MTTTKDKVNYSDMWKFAWNSYKGIGGYLNPDKYYLDKHPRESDDKYASRQNIAFYVNIYNQKVERYCGYLYKTTPLRTTNNSLIKDIISNVDNAGNSIDVFMSSFSKGAKVRGQGLVLVDMPTAIPDNLAEQKEQRALPYFVDIAPESVHEYKLDKFGKFEYISFIDTIDTSTFEDDNVVDVIRYYDMMTWAILDSEGTVLDGGDHNLGTCPVVFMGENGIFPDIGEFTQVAGIEKRLFNLSSELDDLLRSQTFSVLTIQADNPSDVAISLGTDNAIKYGSGMNAPSFISPDASPATTYQTQNANLVNIINEITYDLQTGMGAESAEALSIRFAGLNGSLSNFASRLEDMEKKLFYIVGLYLGIESDIEIIYPNTFDIIDINAEIAVLDGIKAMGYSLPNYEATKLKSIISNDLNNLSGEEEAVIMTEIEDGKKAVES